MDEENTKPKFKGFLKSHWGKLLISLIIILNYKIIYAVIAVSWVAAMYLPLHQVNYPPDEMMKQQRTEFIGKEIILSPKHTLVRLKNWGGPDTDIYLYVFYNMSYDENSLRPEPEATFKLDKVDTFKVIDVGFHRSSDSYFYCVLKSLNSPELVFSEKCLDLEKINNESKDYLKAESVLKKE
jgi:hypothetical protein